MTDFRFSEHDRKIMPSFRISDAPDTRSEAEAAARVHRSSEMSEPEIRLPFGQINYDTRYWMANGVAFCTLNGRYAVCRGVPTLQDLNIFFIELFTDRLGWTRFNELQPNDIIWAYFTPEEREAQKKFKATMYAPVPPPWEQAGAIFCGIGFVVGLVEIALRLL